MLLSEVFHPFMKGCDSTSIYSNLTEVYFNSSYKNMETFYICKSLKTYKNYIQYKK